MMASFDGKLAKAEPFGEREAKILTNHISLACEPIRRAIESTPALRSRKVKPAVFSFKGWKPASGDWTIKSESIEVNSSSLEKPAAYIWSPSPIQPFDQLDFDIEFQPDPNGRHVIDFRLALFGASTTDTYDDRNHILVIAPWGGDGPSDGGEDHRVDEMVVGRASQLTQARLNKKMRPGQRYRYRIKIYNTTTQVIIDDEMVLCCPLRVQTWLRQGTLWGFSTHSSRYRISNLIKSTVD